MSTTTLHLPLDKQLRDRFTKRAEELGFDSAQAYLRVLIKAAVDGRQVDFNADDAPVTKMVSAQPMPLRRR